MKKFSLVATLALVMVNNVMATPEIELGGQGVIYYQTNNNGSDDFLSQHSSSANAGLQIDLKSDLGNDFGLGYQGTFLGTLGLEKNLVSGVRQHIDQTKLNGYATTKLFLSKNIANTSIKLGRQELPKSLSPLAFSEGWNVFKNTFDAVVIANKDIEDTTLVGAFVGASNSHADLSTFDDLAGGSGSGLAKSANNLESGALMLTIANKSIKDLPITATYYALKDINATTSHQSGNALWLDVKANQLPIKMAFQAGQIDPSNSLSKTKAYGVKASGKVEDLALSLSYSHVNDGAVHLRNVGTGIKTPLYTQMIGNQNFIASDNDTFVLKAVKPLPVGKLIAVYDTTNDTSLANNDYQELDVVYKFKALGTDMLLAYIGQKTKNPTFGTDKDSNNLRFWTRYHF